jgi:hypothetical protein
MDCNRNKLKVSKKKSKGCKCNGKSWIQSIVVRVKVKSFITLQKILKDHSRPNSALWWSWFIGEAFSRT